MSSIGKATGILTRDNNHNKNWERVAYKASEILAGVAVLLFTIPTIARTWDGIRNGKNVIK